MKNNDLEEAKEREKKKKRKKGNEAGVGTRRQRQKKTMGPFFFYLFFALPFLCAFACYRYVSVRCSHLFLFSCVRRVDGVSRKNTNGVRMEAL